MDLSRIPHPPGRVPLLGDVRGVSPGTPLQDSIRLGRELGPVFARKFLRRQTVFVGDPQLVAELADEKRFTKHVGLGVRHLRAVAGDGLFTAHSREPNWQLAHDILTPGFARAALESYHPAMLAAADELLASWDRHADARPAGGGDAGDGGRGGEGGGPVDVTADMTKLTLETIGRTGFGYDFGSFGRDRPHPFVSAMLGTLRHAQRKTFRLPLVGGLLGRRADRRNERDVAYLRHEVDRVVAARRADGGGCPAHRGAQAPPAGADAEAGTDADAHAHADAEASAPDLLGLMLETAHPRTGERLDPVNVRHQVLTFLVAGHETTSGALSFALYHLTRSPEALAAAQAEVDRVWGAADDPRPAFADVARLRYVRRVVDETLRLWPTAPAFFREAREDTVLGGVHPMRRGEWVVVLTPLLHRAPEVWGPDPEAFDPDRFAPGEARRRPAHTYKPFGTGARACIGRQFALHEAVLALGLLLHRYRLRAADPGYRLRVAELLTVRPEGFRIRLSRRTPAERAAGAAESAGGKASA